MKKNNYHLLFHSFDAEIPEALREELEEETASTAELQRIKREVQSMRRTLQTAPPPAFSPFFVERVLARIQRRSESIAERFQNTFRPIAAGALVLIAIFTSYNIGRTNSFTVEAALGIQRPSLEQKLSLEIPLE
jgi:hypothetical protein